MSSVITVLLVSFKHRLTAGRTLTSVDYVTNAIQRGQLPTANAETTANRINSAT